jgi:hypothetical protein
MTASVSDNKKCVGKAQASTHEGQCCSCTQSTALESEKICDMMFPVTPYEKNINTHHHAMGFYVVSLKNPSGAHAHCIQQAVET